MTATNPPTAPMMAPKAPSLQLNDIHLPEQINNFPIALGWWLLTAALLLLLIFMLKKYQRNKRLSLYKRQAIKQINDNPNISANEVISLLKWVAMQYFNRAVTANLFGDNFQQFLNDQLAEKHQTRFIELSTPAFKAQYQQLDSTNTRLTHNTENHQVESELSINNKCKAAAMLWLKEALLIKHDEPNTKGRNKIGVLAHD